MIVLRCAIFLAALTGAWSLGASECTYGPSFWCGSLRNAKQCTAVTHCIQTVWEKQQLAPDNDDICQICKNMVQEARDTLESNTTQEELKQVFEGSCNLIPFAEVRSECITLADQFIPELIETLASQMNPQMVCATAGLCNSVRIDRLLREKGMLEDKPSHPVAEMTSNSVAVTSVGGDCQDCNKFIQDYINYVKEHSEQELMNRLLTICGDLGSVSDGCAALVSVNINTIYNYITHQVDPQQLCSLFGMCGSAFAPMPTPVPEVSGDETCDFCIAIGQHWKDILSSNMTEEQLEEILRGTCDFAGAFRQQCLSIVENYDIPFYNWLVSEFDPKQACEAVGLCPSNIDRPIWTTFHTGERPADALLEEEEPVVQRLPIRPSGHLIGGDEAQSYRLTNGQKPTLPRVPLTTSIRIKVAGESGVLSGGDEACTMCELVLHFVQNELQDKTTKNEIETVVKSICSRLPKDLSEECDDYVDAYGDQLIALLQQEIDPSILCPMMGLCNKTTSVPTGVDQPIGNKDVTCVACEYIMVKIKEILGNRTDEEAVRDALDRVCSLLPHSLSSDCITFVDQNAIEVMQLLAGGVDPMQVCKMLGFCNHSGAGKLPALDSSNQLPMNRLFLPSQTQAAVAPAKSKLETSGQSKVCVLCEFIINLLEGMIEDNRTRIEADIELYMKMVCLRLPSSLTEDCVGFVEQYGKAIVNLLINDADPKFVCREAKLCAQANFEGLMTNLVSSRQKRSTPASAVSSEDTCLICKAVARVAGDAPAGSTTALEALCATMTPDQQAVCTEMYQNHLATLQGGGSNTSGRDVSRLCSELHYCPSNAQGLLGAEACTRGPGFWCHNLLTSQSCGATSYCQERIWNAATP